MQPPDYARAHALSGVQHAPAGMLLPGERAVEAPRDGGSLFDVLGGIAFACFIALLCMRGARWLVEVGIVDARHGGWPLAMAWESIWLVAAMACAPLLTTGIRHDISVRSTLMGLVLDWPELVLGTSVFVTYVQYLGELRIEAGPLGLALAVGTAEELLFRVLLLGWLVSRLPAPTALSISACVFGMAHLHELSLLGLASVVPQTAGGFVLGAVYLRTRNPLGPILTHAYWDYPYFMALGAGVSGGTTAGGYPPLLQLAPWLVFILYGLWLVRDGVPMVGRVEPVQHRPETRIGGPAWSPRTSIS